MNYTFAEALAVKVAIEREQDILSKQLNSYPKGPMGLTPEAIRLSPEFRALRMKYDRVTKKLIAFNRPFMKQFKKEYRAWVDAQRAAKFANLQKDA